jgi:hypothetical protein
MTSISQEQRTQKLVDTGNKKLADVFDIIEDALPILNDGKYLQACNDIMDLRKIIKNLSQIKTIIIENPDLYDIVRRRDIVRMPTWFEEYVDIIEKQTHYICDCGAVLSKKYKNQSIFANKTHIKTKKHRNVIELMKKSHNGNWDTFIQKQTLEREIKIKCKYEYIMNNVLEYIMNKLENKPLYAVFKRKHIYRFTQLRQHLFKPIHEQLLQKVNIIE